MPANYRCFSCGEEFDGPQEYRAHFTVCDAEGCGDWYCGETYAVCNYCDGNGYYPEYDDDDDGDYDDYDDGRGIYSYDFKPEPIWFGGRRQPYYLGFELEISAERYDTAPISAWCKNNGHADMLYCKEDGSVEGFEIVSHPMTPEYFDSVNWDGFFNMLENNYPMHGRDEPTGHGLHVHVSRTAFPHNSTLARWSYLLNRHESHVNRVARRSYSNWARFTSYPVRMCLPYERGNDGTHYETGAPICEHGCCFERVLVRDTARRIRHQFQTVGYPERYQAVNLTNENTVEVRVFKSTRKPDEFISSLHFVAATVEFVRNMQPWNATRESVAWERFTEYVQSHPVFAKETPLFSGSAIAEPANV